MNHDINLVKELGNYTIYEKDIKYFDETPILKHAVSYISGHVNIFIASDVIHALKEETSYDVKYYEQSIDIIAFYTILIEEYDESEIVRLIEIFYPISGSPLSIIIKDVINTVKTVARDRNVNYVYFCTI